MSVVKEGGKPNAIHGSFLLRVDGAISKVVFRCDARVPYDDAREMIILGIELRSHEINAMILNVLPRPMGSASSPPWNCTGQDLCASPVMLFTNL